MAAEAVGPGRTRECPLRHGSVCDAPAHWKEREAGASSAPGATEVIAAAAAQRAAPGEARPSPRRGGLGESAPRTRRDLVSSHTPPTRPPHARTTTVHESPTHVPRDICRSGLRVTNEFPTELSPFQTAERGPRLARCWQGAWRDSTMQPLTGVLQESDGPVAGMSCSPALNWAVIQGPDVTGRLTP